jgi:hypothetical protein
MSATLQTYRTSLSIHAPQYRHIEGNIPALDITAQYASISGELHTITTLKRSRQSAQWLSDPLLAAMERQCAEQART